jgi:hypothetical protein
MSWCKWGRGVLSACLALVCVLAVVCTQCTLSALCECSDLNKSPTVLNIPMSIPSWVADCVQAMRTIRLLTSEPSVLQDMKNSGAISQLVSKGQMARACVWQCVASKAEGLSGVLHCCSSAVVWLVMP